MMSLLFGLVDASKNSKNSQPPTLVFWSADASTGCGESESESEIEDDVKSIHSERSYQMDSEPDSD